MKRPVTALLLAEELIDRVERGEKYNTIREGIRDYQTGDKLVLVCPDVAWSSALKTVSRVIHTNGKEMEKAHYKHQGWKSREAMVEDLKRFYPNLTMDSPLTVVWWID